MKKIYTFLFVALFRSFTASYKSLSLLLIFSISSLTHYSTQLNLTNPQNMYLMNNSLFHWRSSKIFLKLFITKNSEKVFLNDSKTLIND